MAGRLHALQTTIANQQYARPEKACAGIVKNGQNNQHTSCLKLMNPLSAEVIPQ